MDRVAALPANDRAELFRETAARMGLGPVPIEKDFWVCWAVAHVFACDGPPLIFKGGTSLSKAYGLIDRFSEDIDLAFDRRAFGFTGDRDPLNAASGKAAQRLIKELVARCVDHIASDFVPALEQRFGAVLQDDWSLKIDSDEAKIVHFRYPASLSTDDYGATSYVQPQVLLELGARSDQSPSETKSVASYAAQEFPDQFRHLDTETRVLDVRRTFWEKATLVHVLYNRPNPDETSTLRKSRHYYDMFQLARSPIRASALADRDLLRRVVRHKSVFFRSAWAGYGDAATGGLHLAPHETLANLLRKDYAKMQDMFFTSPPPFEDILTELTALETEINALTTP